MTLIYRRERLHIAVSGTAIAQCMPLRRDTMGGGRKTLVFWAQRPKQVFR